MDINQHLQSFRNDHDNRGNQEIHYDNIGSYRVGTMHINLCIALHRAADMRGRVFTTAIIVFPQTNSLNGKIAKLEIVMTNIVQYQFPAKCLL